VTSRNELATGATSAVAVPRLVVVAAPPAGVSADISANRRPKPPDVIAADPFTLPVKGDVVDKKKGIVGSTKDMSLVSSTRLSAALGSLRGGEAGVQ